VAVITFLASLFFYSFPRTFYVVETRYNVAQDPLPITEIDEEARLFNWRTSEYIVFGLKDWIDGSVFSKEVIAEMIARGVDENDLDLEDVMESISSNASRSQLFVTVQADTEEKAWIMAMSVQKIVEEKHSDFIPQLEFDPARLDRVAGDLVEEFSPTLVQRVSLLRNIVFAVIAGIFAAIIVEIFTPRLDSKQEVEHIGMIVLGQIPEKI
jgi:hypothetical protein